MSWAIYDAYPTNFSEFLTAIAQEETRVILPVDAVWDANDFCPEGYVNQTWQINCDQILGQGTTIKNLKLTDSYFNLRMSKYSNKARLDAWDGLNLINMVISYSDSVNSLFNVVDRVSTIDGETVPTAERRVGFNGSQISGMISKVTGSSSFNPFGEMHLWCSAANLEIIHGGGTIKSLSLGRQQEYCNLKVATQGFTSFIQLSGSPYGATYSWFDLYGDDVTDVSITKGAEASAFRCSCPITTVSKAKAGYPSVIAVPDVSAVTVPSDSNLIVCTDAQLRDENFLHENGFPIAVTP